jgi:2,3-bisphosphoglycerate-dependent phosphoglycerate mutase
MEQMGVLLLLRHGQSQWNLENRFTGWTDISLTDQGEKDALTVAKNISDMTFDLAFTSRLKRAQKTLEIIMKGLKQEKVPVMMDSALNERHYGDLQGLNKAETATKCFLMLLLEFTHFS